MSLEESVKFMIDGLAMKIMEEKNEEIKREALQLLTEYCMQLQTEAEALEESEKFDRNLRELVCSIEAKEDRLRRAVRGRVGRRRRSRQTHNLRKQLLERNLRNYLYSHVE